MEHVNRQAIGFGSDPRRHAIKADSISMLKLPKLQQRDITATLLQVYLSAYCSLS